jgi:hypothetical protein
VLDARDLQQLRSCARGDQDESRAKVPLVDADAVRTGDGRMPFVDVDTMIFQRFAIEAADPRNFGESYATSSALLILQMPRRYLPIFQR